MGKEREGMAARIAELVGRVPVLLHFDINRTIIQVDPAGGKSLVDILNNNIATESLGRVVDGAWKIVRGPADAADAAEARELVSYDDFVDSQFPKPEGMDRMAPQDARALWADVSEKRRYLKKVFTAPGQPGEAFRPLVDRQLAQLRLPGAPDAYYHIIPAFFRTVNDLVDADVNFNIVFRTFGVDLVTVLDDWRRFASGQHVYPCSERVKKRFGGIDPITAALYRDSSGMFCTAGAARAAPLAPTSSIVPTLEYLTALPGYGDTRTASHDDLLALVQKGGVLGLVDFYPWWAAHGESASAGKVFPVHVAPSADTPYQVFFDDNAFPGDEHSIVDLRSVESGAAITDPVLHELYTHKVRPLQAVTSDDYFLAVLEDKLQQQRILRQAQGCHQ